MKHVNSLFALALLLLTSCGGGSGSAADAGANPVSELEPLEVLFPPRRSLTYAETVGVRGTSPLKLDWVKVNGVEAVSDDEFLSWKAMIPLVDGENHLLITSAKGELAQTNYMHEYMRRDVLVQTPRAVAVDPVSGRVYVTGGNPDVIAVLDADSLELIDALPPSSEGQLQTNHLNDLVIHPESGHLYCVTYNKIIEVDPDTGERSVLSESNNPDQGPGIDGIQRMTMGLFGTPAEWMLFGVRGHGAGNGELVMIDPVTGERKVLLEGFHTPSAIDYDPASGRVVFSAGSPYSGGSNLFGVDLESLEVEELAGPEGAEGPWDGLSCSELWASDLAITPDGSRAFVTQLDGGYEGEGAIVEVDLVTGVYRVISRKDPDALSTTAIKTSGSIALLSGDGINFSLLVPDWTSSVYQVETQTGARAPVFGDCAGSGERLIFPNSLAIDTERDQLLSYDRSRKALGAVSLVNGERTIPREDGDVTPPERLLSTHATVVDATADKLYSFRSWNGFNNLVAVDLETMESEIVSEQMDEYDPDLSWSYDSWAKVALDEAGQRLFVLTRSVIGSSQWATDIWKVDLSNQDTTLNRTRILQVVEGSVTAMNAMVYDPKLDRLLLAGKPLIDGVWVNQVLEVNPETGAHFVLVDNANQSSSWSYNLSLDLEGNRLLSVDGSGAVVSLDLDTLAIDHPVYSNTPNGPMPLGTNNTAYSVKRGVIYCHSTVNCGFYAIDLETGCRVLMSR